jgi:POT family proton-dependent oligopeptide transporter
MMAAESIFFIALTFLILGNGAFKPNITSEVGLLYEMRDPRRDRAYSIFYFGINLGAFFAPLVCGTLATVLAWRYGFEAAGIGMVISLGIYLLGLRTLPKEKCRLLELTAQNAPTADGGWQAVAALLVIGLLQTFFWMVYSQMENTIMHWAEEYTNRLFGDFQTPTPWFEALDPLIVMIFLPLIQGFWRWQKDRGAEPTTLTKMALGCFALALGNLVLY